MELNVPSFRLKLNLFDGIILAIALAAAAVLAWLILSPPLTDKDDVTQGTAQYTVHLTRWPEGTSSLVQIGDEITDNLYNRALGEIVDIKTEPCRILVVDVINRRQVMAEVEGYEDVLVTLESPCEIHKFSVTAGEDHYPLQVGNMAFLRGAGYMGSGVVERIEITEIFEDGEDAGK